MGLFNTVLLSIIHKATTLILSYLKGILDKVVKTVIPQLTEATAKVNEAYEKLVKLEERVTQLEAKVAEHDAKLNSPNL